MTLTGPAHGAPLSSQWARDVTDLLNGWDVPQTYTPTLTQSVAVAKTVAQNASTFARYFVRGRWCTVELCLAITGAGTAANEIIVGLPLAGAYGTSLPVGLGSVFDTSAAAQHIGAVIMHTTSAFKMFPTNLAGVSAIGAGGMTAGLANGDVLRAQFFYELAA